MTGTNETIEIELTLKPEWLFYVVGVLCIIGLKPIAGLIVDRAISVRRIR